MKTTIKLEELALFALAMVAWARLDYYWWLFVLLLLAPDLSMPEPIFKVLPQEHEKTRSGIRFMPSMSRSEKNEPPRSHAGQAPLPPLCPQKCTISYIEMLSIRPPFDMARE